MEIAPLDLDCTDTDPGHFKGCPARIKIRDLKRKEN